MKDKKPIQIWIRRSFWLLMACCCIVFSGAIKKILKLRANQKISLIIHTDNDGTRPSQNIKDGHREKHEPQAIAFTNYKQSPAPGFHPSTQAALLQASPALLNLYTWTSAMVSYKSCQRAAFRTLPEYLLFRRLQV